MNLSKKPCEVCRREPAIAGVTISAYTLGVRPQAVVNGKSLLLGKRCLSIYALLGRWGAAKAIRGRIQSLIKLLDGKNGYLKRT